MLKKAIIELKNLKLTDFEDKGFDYADHETLRYFGAETQTATFSLTKELDTDEINWTSMSFKFSKEQPEIKLNHFYGIGETWEEHKNSIVEMLKKLLGEK